MIRSAFPELACLEWLVYGGQLEHRIGSTRPCADIHQRQVRGSRILGLAVGPRPVFPMSHRPNCGVGGAQARRSTPEQPVFEKIPTHLGVEARAPPWAPARWQALQAACAPPKQSAFRRPGAQGHKDRLRPGFAGSNQRVGIGRVNLDLSIRCTSSTAVSGSGPAAVDHNDRTQRLDRCARPPNCRPDAKNMSI